MLERKHQILPSVFYLATALLFAGLGRFAAAGLSSRYWADDYCYSAVLAAGGFLRGPVDWFMASGNRFSTIYLIGLQDLFGPWAIRLIPGLIILVLSAAWLVFLFSAAREIGARPGILTLLPMALTQVFFLLLVAPDRLQALYWRMGTLHYTFPLALLLFNLALILNKLSAPRRWLYPVGIFVLAFFAGGFSETFAALQVGAYALACAAAVVFLPHALKGNAAARILPALVGSLVATGLMLLSPSNAWRQAALPPPESLGQFLAYTLQYTFDFVHNTLRGSPPAPGFGPFEWCVRLSCLVLSSAPALPAHNLHCRRSFPAFRACAFSMRDCPQRLRRPAVPRRSSPHACALRTPVRAGRGRRLPGGAAAGLCPAWVRLDHPRLADLLLIFTLLAGSFYIGRQLALPLPEQAAMAAWAQRWDERDASIRSFRAAGETDLILRETEVVRGLEDLGPDPSQWVNRCATAYYRVHSITAFP